METQIHTLVEAQDVNWGFLNPLRGNKSPGAANLWGNRLKNEATGMLVRFNKGFSSPPHIHNISYRGVVINGLLHNADPNVEKMWMPAGSFWTQPAGANHITAANGEENLIYLEIDAGPYLVKPSSEHFDNRERPVNLHRDNLVWLKQEQASVLSGEGLEISYLWGAQGDENTGGALLRLPPGFSGRIRSQGTSLKAVLISGSAGYGSKDAAKTLMPGSYFASEGNFSHLLTTEKHTVLYLRSTGAFSVNAG